ncbi:MAG: hypothetical protein AAF985_24355 [Bacteroidota bacterium]
MLPRLLAFPFLVALGVLLYLTYFIDSGYGIYMLPVVIALVFLYILQPQIDWWWYNRNLPDLEEPMQRLLAAKLPYYKKLDKDQQLRFRQRCALYLLANDFIPQGPKVVPEDIKGLLAANVVQLTFGQMDYRLSMFERVVIYTIPFPSPQYPEHLHSSELFAEDGVLLFTADHLVKGTLENQRYFNVGLYEYAKVFRLSYPKYAYPVEGLSWEALEKVSGFITQKVKDYVGLPELDILAVAIVYFFCFPTRFRTNFPEVSQQLQVIFNQDPSQEGNPVIHTDRIGKDGSQ